MIKRQEKGEIKFNKWRWLIVYMISIIIFAYIYTRLPFHFYHMTTQYEPQLTRLCNQVKSYIEVDLKENFMAKYPSGAIYLDEKRESICYIDNLHVRDFSYENNVPSITLAIDLIQNLDETLHTEIKVVLEKPYLETKEGITLVGKVKRETRTGELIHEIDLDSMRYEDMFYMSSNQNLVGMKVSKKTFEQMRSYGMAVKGFPVNIEGNFFRMLYLSMITITGLGYGDIVPITNLARTLIGIEAVWGIILLALFGNDIIKDKPVVR